MGFENLYNKYAKKNNELSKKLNNIIGKDVFTGTKEIEAPKEYQAYENFPPYTEPEPAQWTPLNGEAKQFSLQGHTFSVSANFDTAMQYKELFKVSARYYADRFKFKYQCCINDYDSFIHYFPEAYLDCLNLMLQRVYSLLLPFGIFNISFDSFFDKHKAYFHRAIDSYDKLAEIEIEKNRQAKESGDLIGNSIRLQGGGFGLKGTAKGIAQAEAFNLGMSALGKLAEFGNRMSAEEKANVYTEFNQDTLFEEVYDDYLNSFLTLFQTLSDNKVIEPINIAKANEFNTMIQNLQNPMFPQDRIAESLIKVITNYPFAIEGYRLLISKFGQTEDVNQITDYFIG